MQMLFAFGNDHGSPVGDQIASPPSRSATVIRLPAIFLRLRLGDQKLAQFGRVAGIGDVQNEPRDRWTVKSWPPHLLGDHHDQRLLNPVKRDAQFLFECALLCQTLYQWRQSGLSQQIGRPNRRHRDDIAGHKCQ